MTAKKKLANILKKILRKEGNTMSKKDARHLSWGLFWSKNLFKKLKDVRIYFKRRRFLLKNGYPPQANYETYYWFICIMRPILQYYIEKREGSPMLPGTTEENCHEEWTKVLNTMLEYLNNMDEENSKYDEMDLLERDKCMSEAKEKFFMLFTEYFYNFWD